MNYLTTDNRKKSDKKETSKSVYYFLIEVANTKSDPVPFMI